MMFSGRRLFDLKATHGLPLDFTLGALNDRDVDIDIDEFIEAARENQWWDFQTYDALRYAMLDAGFSREQQADNLHRFRNYVLHHPLAGIAS